jgi:4-hydroxybenzoate polyprenyltransferase
LTVAFTASLAIYIPISILKPDILTDKHFQFLLMMAFLSTLIRELVKDMEDQSVDRKFGYQTLPIINLKLSKIIFIILINLIWLIMFSYQVYFQPTTYKILLFIISLLLIFSLIKVYQNQYETATKLIKLLMLIGIFSIFII